MAEETVQEINFTPLKLKVGDKVYYSLHGPGIVKELTSKKVLDQERKYYIIELLPPTRMKVMIPVDYEAEVGIRKIIAASEISKVITVLKEKYDAGAEHVDWKNRYQINLEKIKSGDIMEIARVANQLFKRNKRKDLSVMEKKLYEQAYQLITNEISLAKGISPDEAQDMISKVLE